MSAHDETQHIASDAVRTAAAPDAPTTQLRAPAPLDLAGSERADPTDVLRLDELFDRPAEPRVEPPPAPARSSAQQPARPVAKRSAAVERLLDDAAAAWDGAVRRGETWLRSGDNALMAVTALAAIVLILVVATFGA